MIHYLISSLIMKKCVICFKKKEANLFMGNKNKIVIIMIKITNRVNYQVK